MTESEAKGFVQGKLDCMNKCDIFNKEDKHSDKDCDNCEYCYSQGNFGEQKEAFSVAINALEKQIPKKAVNYDKHYYKCPFCNEDLEIDDDMLFVYDEEPPKFCIKCGQKLDWSDEE